jgi:hypothetical protein
MHPQNKLGKKTIFVPQKQISMISSMFGLWQEREVALCTKLIDGGWLGYLLSISYWHLGKTSNSKGLNGSYRTSTHNGQLTLPCGQQAEMQQKEGHCGTDPTHHH